jgi:hypothetical protein
MKKKKILAWGDSPTSTTGLGKVNQEILKRLVATKEYEVTFVGVHYLGQEYDKKIYPYKMIVANPDKSDLLGRNIFLSILSSRNWDVVFTHTDLQYMNSITDFIVEERAKQHFKWIAYSPIDNDQFLIGDIKCFDKSNFPATYSNFGKKVITDLSSGVGNRLTTMWLGTDLEKFKPVTKEGKLQLRNEIFGITDPDTFLVLNVNANVNTGAGLIGGFD